MYVHKRNSEEEKHGQTNELYRRTTKMTMFPARYNNYITYGINETNTHNEIKVTGKVFTYIVHQTV